MAVTTTPSRVPTYTATFRAAARPYSLAPTPGANSRTVVAALWHTVAATRLLRLRWAAIFLESVAVAGIFSFELVRISSAPTGGTAITPAPVHDTENAAEATAIALPSGGAAEVAGLLGSIEFNVGITGAAPTTSPPAPVPWTTLYVATIDEQDWPSAPIGVADGFAIVMDANVAASTPKVQAVLEFTEEAAV